MNPAETNNQPKEPIRISEKTARAVANISLLLILALARSRPIAAQGIGQTIQDIEGNPIVQEVGAGLKDSLHGTSREDGSGLYVCGGSILLSFLLGIAGLTRAGIRKKEKQDLQHQYVAAVDEMKRLELKIKHF